jgi:hypothetical protein
MVSGAETAIIVIVAIILFLLMIFWMVWLSKQLDIPFIVVFVITIFTGGIGLLVLTIMALLPENKKQHKEINTSPVRSPRKSPVRSPRKSPVRSPRKSPSKK